MNRHHVYLYADLATATVVAKRRKQPIILQVNASGMASAGYQFWLSDNGVWLTDAVPAQFLKII